MHRHDPCPTDPTDDHDQACDAARESGTRTRDPMTGIGRRAAIIRRRKETYRDLLEGLSRYGLVVVDAGLAEVAANKQLTRRRAQALASYIADQQLARAG